MAKSVYRIPGDLNASYGDMEIALQNDSGVGVRPLPIKVIFSYIIGIMLGFFIMAKTFVSHGNILQHAIFIALYGCLLLVMFRFDGTKRMQIELIPTLFDYLPKMNRYITTRSTSMATGFYNIAGIKSIDKRTGRVEHTDGTYSYWYRVTGSASILLFSGDKSAILAHVDSFYKAAPTDVEFIFVTTKSSQKVYRQLANLKRRYDALVYRDPDLIKLANDQFHDLKDFVGVEFKSIHQYLVLKADNKEALTRARSILQSEVERSSLMIKHCTAMYYDDIVDLLSLVYTGAE